MRKEDLSPYKANADHEGLYYYNARGEKVCLDPKAMSNAIIQERQEEEEQEEEEMSRERTIQALTENEVENMSSRDVYSLLYSLNEEKTNDVLMEEYNDCHTGARCVINDSFDLDRMRIDDTNARDVFMQIYRSGLLNTLSVDDRHEVFSGIMLGNSDFTAELLNDVLSNYDVNNLEVRERTEEELKEISDYNRDQMEKDLERMKS